MDQTIQSEIQQFQRLAESQAIAELPENTMADTMNFKPDPPQVHEKEHSKSGGGEGTFTIESPFHKITVVGADTSIGGWVQLTYANDYDLATPILVNNILDLDFYYMLGIPIGSFPTAGTVSIPPFGQTNNEFWRYYYNRLNWIEFTWKDFMLTIERTASGGIQFKDEPIYEIAFYPIDYAKTQLTQAVQTFTMPGGTFKRRYNLGGTYGTLNDLYVSSDNQGTHYRILGDWFGTSLQQSSPISLFPWQVVRRPALIGCVPEECWIRCRNMPVGLTNVTVQLKYTVECKANWSFLGRINNMFAVKLLNWRPKIGAFHFTDEDVNNPAYKKLKKDSGLDLKRKER